MGQLTSAGFIPERLNHIITSLQNGFRRIYGNDINLDPDSPDGQMIGLIAQHKADIEELAEAIYQALDPDHAKGAWLEQRVAYAGLTRKTASYSYLRNVVLTGRPQAIIPAGSVVSDANKIRWLLVNNTALNADGSARVDFRSDALGAFSVPVNTELKIETVVLGWSTATTLSPSDIGREEETDPELRNRFYRSRARQAESSVDGIIASISELADVRQVITLENHTNETDMNGVPAHSINVIVDGGDNEQIAQVIFDRKTAGTGMRGDIEVSVSDKRGRKRVIKFDRALPVYCTALLKIQRNENFTAIDVDAIKAAIASTQFKVGESVKLSRLYTPVNTVEGFFVDEFTIGRVSEVMTSGNIDVGIREQARFSAEDVEVIVL